MSGNENNSVKMVKPGNGAQSGIRSSCVVDSRSSFDLWLKCAYLANDKVVLLSLFLIKCFSYSRG